MVRKLQIKRGNKANLPNLAAGEFGLVLDEKKLYIGEGTQNIELANADLSNVPSETLKAAVESSGVQSGVSGVKGNAETSYRTGQVNLTPANIGAADKATNGGGFVGGSGTYNMANTGGAIGLNANTDGGGAVGNGATASGNGGAVGYNAQASDGGAVGMNALATTTGGAVGAGATSDGGFAGGTNAVTSDGVAVGANAKTIDSKENSIDAIQLGTGTNSNEYTLQVYDYQLMRDDGKIPVERIELKPSDIDAVPTSRTVNGKALTGDITLTSSDINYTNNTTGMTSATVQGAIDELFTSVSDGKSMIATAVTDKGVQTSAGATWAQMQNNIYSIPTIDKISNSQETGTLNPNTGGRAGALVGYNATVTNYGASTPYTGVSSTNSWAKNNMIYIASIDRVLICTGPEIYLASVSGTPSIVHKFVNPNVTTQSNAHSYMVAQLSDKKFVCTYEDSTSSTRYGYAMVLTVSASSISAGAKAQISTGTSSNPAVCTDVVALSSSTAICAEGDGDDVTTFYKLACSTVSNTVTVTKLTTSNTSGSAEVSWRKTVMYPYSSTTFYAVSSYIDTSRVYNKLAIAKCVVSGSTVTFSDETFYECEPGAVAAAAYASISELSSSGTKKNLIIASPMSKGINAYKICSNSTKTPLFQPRCLTKIAPQIEQQSVLSQYTNYVSFTALTNRISVVPKLTSKDVYLSVCYDNGDIQEIGSINIYTETSTAYLRNPMSCRINANTVLVCVKQSTNALVLIKCTVTPSFKVVTEMDKAVGVITNVSGSNVTVIMP